MIKPLVIFKNQLKLNLSEGKYNFDRIFSVSLITCTCYLEAVFARSLDRSNKTTNRRVIARTNKRTNKQTNKSLNYANKKI